MANDERLMDNILITFGKMLAGREHRKESEQTVSEEMMAWSGNTYELIWHTGNTMDIILYPDDEFSPSNIKIATFNLNNPYLGFNRTLATMVYGVITGCEKALKGE